jgi:hypothetical protein
VGGVDPIDMRFDSRFVREAALKEAKRAQFKAQLDEQVALKKRAAEERARRERMNPGFLPTREENVSSDRGGGERLSHHSQILTSPPRESMQGVPRRGVNPGNGEYSSPLARAGGGPSSFYLGGGRPVWRLGERRRESRRRRSIHALLRGRRRVRGRARPGRRGGSPASARG